MIFDIRLYHRLNIPNVKMLSFLPVSQIEFELRDHLDFSLALISLEVVDVKKIMDHKK